MLKDLVVANYTKLLYYTIHEFASNRSVYPIEVDGNSLQLEKGNQSVQFCPNK